MVNIFVDTETYKQYDGSKESEEYIKTFGLYPENGLKKGNLYPVLDAREFKLGCIIYENSNKVDYFYNKKDMWNHIIAYGRKLANQDKLLNVYAHNHIYDLSAYGDITHSSLEWMYKSPIAVFKEGGKPIVKFLDTTAIFPRMSVDNIGELINIKKKDMPKELKYIPGFPLEATLQPLKSYVKRDCEILKEALLWIKGMCNKIGYKPVRVFTIGQLAIAIIIKLLKEANLKDWAYDWKGNDRYSPRTLIQNDLFFDKERGTLWTPKNPELIHEAYRGGGVKAFKLELLKDIDIYDINSLWPYSIANMDMPNLRTERVINEPLKEMKLDELLDRPGVSKCMLKNISDEHGLIQVRIKYQFNYHPIPGQIIIGTYTNTEIKCAVESGRYELLDIEWSLIYDKMEFNPFKPIIEKLYKYKKNSKDKQEEYFWKLILNSGISKFAQNKSNVSTKIIDVGEIDDYIKRGYQMKRGFDMEILCQKELKKEMKSFYQPIIPTLFTAYARVNHWKQIKDIPIERCVYYDTDSIAVHNNGSKLFRQSKELGKWKTVQYNDLFFAYGSKTYMDAKEIKIAGIRKRDITREDFLKGKVKSKRMLSIKSTTDVNRVGTFIEEYRDLLKQREKHMTTMEILDAIDLHIDNNITDINYFLKRL